jgi:hypothetical protein
VGRRLHRLIPLVALAGCGRVGFADDFEPASAAQWTTFFDPGVEVTGGQGELAIALPDQGEGYGGVYITGTVDLTGDAFQVESVELPDQTTPAEMVLEMKDPVWRAAIGVSNAKLIYIVEHRDHTMTTQSDTPYIAATDRHWQLGVVGDEVVFATSPDGNAWTVRKQLPSPLDTTNVSIVLYAGSFGAPSMPWLARFAGARTTNCR